MKIQNSKVKIKKLGFTLIELLVVISIIGILASLALASYSGAQKQTRDTQRRSDLNQYRNGLEQYAASNNGLYPNKQSPYNVLGFCGSTGDLRSYLSSCPDDPLANLDYFYISSPDRTKYILYADIETDGRWYVCSTGKTGTKEQTSMPGIGDCP